ncbi:MAG: YceD family protein [Francisellaceae bacterium]
MAFKNIDHIAVKAATDQALRLETDITLDHLSDMNVAIEPGACSFHVKIAFSRFNHKPILSGHIHGRLKLICQRSLEPFCFEIDHDFKLGLVEDERFFKDFPHDAEPFVYENGHLDLMAIVIEEILLSIPMIPKKSLNDCQVNENTAYYGVSEISDDDKVEKTNPFEVLKEIKFK